MILSWRTLRMQIKAGRRFMSVLSIDYPLFLPKQWCKLSKSVLLSIGVMLNDIASGDLLGRDGQTVTVAKDIRNDSGEATLTLSRLPGTAGVSGSGALATFSFVAVGRGSANLLVTEFGLRNSQNSPIVIAPPAVKIEVQ